MVSALPERRALVPEPREADEAAPAWPEPSDNDSGDLVVLSMSDLVSDANGEVVLFNDSGLRSLALGVDAAVVAEGKSGRHVTAAGEDVSGFRYMAFDNGVKLYFRPELELILVRKEG
jgi:hypothetical protein